MTKDEALRLALEALESGIENKANSVVWIEYDCQLVEQAITAIKAALEAKDEPWPPVSIGVDVTKEGTHVIAMRLRPNGVNEVIYSQFHPLAQLEAKDEPMAWMRTSGTGSPVVTEALLSEMPEMRWNFQKPLYTTPPQRKPLTDEEIYTEARNHEKFAKDGREWFDRGSFARAIEAKLKERNS